MTPVASLSVGRLAPAAALLGDGSVLVAGGSFDLNFTIGLTSAERYVSEDQEGAYLSPAGDFSVLSGNPDGTFIRTYKDGTVVSFNALGLMTAVTDRNGNATTYAYDVGGRLTGMTDPVGQSWTLAYDGNGMVQSITDPATRTTAFAHDTQGNLTQIIKPDGQSITYAYDPQHRLSARTDERGKIATNIYDEFGRLARVNLPTGETRRIVPMAVQGLADIASGSGTYANAGYVVQRDEVRATTTDGNGKETKYAINDLGADTGVTDPLGQVTTISRDGDSMPVQVTRTNGSIVNMTYDVRGNLLTSTEQNDPNGPATTTYTYEPAFSQVTSITEPLDHTTTIAHDAHGNPTTITDARGKTTTLTYDARGLLTSSRDPLGHLAQFGYDALGNVRTVTDLRGKITTLTRDAAGNVTASQDPLGRVTRTEYDPLDRVTRVTDPLSGATRYVYDQAGNLASLTDANNQTTTFTYDDRGLLATSRNPLGQTKSYFYDPAGMLDHVIDAKGQRVEFAYDDGGQPIRKTLKNAGGTVTDTVLYGYDLLGDLTSATDSDSGVSFLYDPAFTFGYDDAGRRTSLNFPNTTRAAYGYDAASQLTSLRYLDAALAVLSKSDYTYDDKGNRDSRTTTDGVTSYTYDNLDRLTGALGPDPANPTQSATETYAYDAVGNRTSSHLATGQVHDTANRLLEDSRFTYTYDANGNLTGKTDKTTSAVTTYDWDVEDRLVAVHLPTQTVTFRYDALGRRIEKAAATETRWLYDQEDIVEELDGTNGLRLRYTHGPGIDEPLARRDAASGTVSYYATDGLGSITDTTDASGQVSAAHRYDSYGNVLGGAAAGGYAFTGREWDPEFESLYYRERYHDPQIGRFLSGDPKGVRGGVNLYAYVADNPTKYTDPRGLEIYPPGGWTEYPGHPPRPTPPGQVYVCCRDIAVSWSVDIAARAVGLHHCFIKTDSIEAGMGPAGSGPLPSHYYGIQTEVVPHNGQAASSYCGAVPDVDQDCVSRELQIGKLTGPWSTRNNCNTFTWDVVEKCSRNH